MTKAEDLARCVTLRSLLTPRIVRVQFQAVNWNATPPVPSTPNQRARMLEELSAINAALIKLTEDTVLLCDSADFTAHHQPDFDTLNTTLERVRDLVGVEVDKKAAEEKAAEAIARTAADAAKAKLKAFSLQRISIPSFGGAMSEWQAFHDLFKTSVIQHPSMTGCEKLAHLKSYLNGEAASIVSSFPPTDANFQVAWDTLIARYHNTRDLVFAHIKKYDDFKPLSSESATGLRKLSDSFKECVRSLAALTVPVDKWDLILVFLGMKKLDPDSKKQWSLAQKPTLPTASEFTDFLESRARALADSGQGVSQKPSPTYYSSKSSSAHHVAISHPPSRNKESAPPCTPCQTNHYLYNCPNYRQKVTQDKWNIVKEWKLCSNCLHPGHQCKNCPSKLSCFKCSKKHHTTLHTDSPQTSKPSASVVSSSYCSNRQPTNKVVLLGTLLVNVQDSRGQTQLCRVFVDNGSEAHFVSEQCIARLGLKKQKIRTPLNSIGHKPGPVSKSEVKLTIESRTQPFSLSLSALVLPKFAGLIPRAHCQSNWSHLEGLMLSDPDYHRAHYTDILLGGAKSGHILLPQIVADSSNPNAPVAINTRFGWMINGEAPAVSNASVPSNPAVHHVTCVNQSHDLDSSISRFWEQEEPESTLHPMSSSDVDCETHFQSTHSLNEDGTYTVELPFQVDAPQLGKSRDAAVRRFLKVEERLSRQPDIKAEYVKSIREFTKLGYLEPVPTQDMTKPPSSTFYMPHREVVKESSATTKVRVVFDASAKSSSGVSLNDILHTGPKLQVDLVPLLMRFMTHSIAVSADIWKFYPQTSVHPNHRDFQRLVWRENPQQPIQDLRMCRVTFGISAAPYLAIRALHELANRVQPSFPWASQVIKEDFLVDNLLSGGPDLQSVLELKAQLLDTMEIGGLKLLKFTSNSKALLDTIPTELRDPSTFLPIDEGEFIKTIGILWNPHSDSFSIKINVPEVPMVTTKRTVLSVIARTFDPLGWLSPVTVVPKILIQNLWKAKLGWDEPLPLHFHQQWRTYCEELPVLQSFNLNRNAFSPPDPSSTHYFHQLHGFSDGSDVAHAACIYIRTEDSDGRVAVRLLTAKTKVNPILKPTTPRSELCGAVLLTSLIATVLKSVPQCFTSIMCWTDSTVVLGRLSADKKLPIFELNRIRKILAILPSYHWRHVKGEENPADAPSRGIAPHQLLDHPLWAHGPSFLLNPLPDLHPVSSCVAAIQSSPISDFLQNCSSYNHILATMSYVLRYLHNHRVKKKERRTGKLSTTELDLALTAIVKVIQSEAFPQELESCINRVTPKSNIKFLAPFIDENGVLRVGGRLQHAQVGYTQKHPALLPKSHNFVEVMARNLHLMHLHAGPTLLLSIIREKFWPIRGLDLAKRVAKRCVICHRVQATTSTQIMGQLPPSRVNPAPPFSKCGVDYAGPFQLALRTGRKPPMVKAYVSVFICMTTKATHLELVSDLSTAAFLAALNRFIARRGLPSCIYSDEGSNFVGAKRELDELRALITSHSHHEAIKDLLTPKGISFQTNPPAAPHHGGLWEAAVKSMKFHLRRILANRHLTVEEFATLLCQVEAILNSRPLTPMSEDPNDYSCLTPGHFLIGRLLVAEPHPDLTDLSVNRLDRWQLVERIRQHIWKSWTREYLSLLQSRPKWFSPLPDLICGTMVLIMDKDSNLGPQQWKLGRITEVFPGPDGKTRVCDVRTNVTVSNTLGTILRRPIVKLSPLPIY